MPLFFGPDPVISRRTALAALGATVAAGGCGPRLGSRGNALGWYALLSDPHIAADPSETLRGETMAAHLAAAVEEILRAEDPPHSVLVNGDLALRRGEPEDYRTFLHLCEPLKREGLDLAVTLGNHDHREHLGEAIADTAPGPVDGKRVGVREGPGIRFVLLDSQDGVDVTAGRLGGEQLSWVARVLDASPDVATVLMVHHHLDRTARPALRDTGELLDLLGPRRQAKAVIFGHTHTWNVRSERGIALVNLPALGYRFAPKEPLGWVAFRPRPGGAELELRCRGGDWSRHGERVSLSWRPS